MSEEFVWHKYPEDRPEGFGSYFVTIVYGLRGNLIKEVGLMSYNPYDKIWVTNDIRERNFIVLAWMVCPPCYQEEVFND